MDTTYTMNTTHRISTSEEWARIGAAADQIESLRSRVKQLEDALDIVLKMRADWLEMADEGYAGAYYAFVKGSDRDWQTVTEARKSV
jgi:hypothetical protein